MNSTETLETIVKAIDDKKGKDILALNMEGMSIITDYNVIAHGNNDRQIQAIARGVIDTCSEKGIEINRIEGKGSTRWILIDLFDVVVHIFSEEDRDFYKLDSLWKEAEQVDIRDWIIEE